MNRISLALAALLALGTVAVSPVAAQIVAVPNSMNFQGRLTTPSGNPVPNGTYSVRFRIYDAVTGGTTLADQTLSSVQVRNGVFAVALTSITAANFNGNTWLGITIGTDAELTPRTQIVSVPYAFKSNLALTVPDGSITNAKIAAGTLTADRFAAGILNPLTWLIGGNTGVTSGYLGTADNNPLEFRVNGRRAMFYQYAENAVEAGFEYRSINVLGGSEINLINAGVVGATIGGGGYDSFTGTDLPNRVQADFGTIGGGAGNWTSGLYSTVGGGFTNTVSGSAGTVGGGQNNTASASYSTVGGGINNTAFATYSTVGGGVNNTASGAAGTVGGGANNTAAGDYSFAAGYRAKANHAGAFVWGDSTGADFASTGINQFLIRASGGVGIGTNAPISALHIAPTSGITLGTNPLSGGYTALQISLSSTSGGAALIQAIQSAGIAYGNILLNRDGGNVGIGTTTPAYKLHVVGDINAQGSVRANGVVLSSDARYKKNIADLASPLETLLNLRGVSYEWNTAQWKDKGFGEGKQIGFIAQEVEKIFPELVTTDANGYKSVNYVGVVPLLVEAVKTQNKKMEALSKENAELKARLERIEAALAELKANK